MEYLLGLNRLRLCKRLILQLSSADPASHEKSADQAKNAGQTGRATAQLLETRPSDRNSDQGRFRLAPRVSPVRTIIVRLRKLVLAATAGAALTSLFLPGP